MNTQTQDSSKFDIIIHPPSLRVNDKFYSSNTQWYPRSLVIGPGGVKGFMVLGFLSPIEDAGLLKYTDTFCGVSIGATISLLIVAGYEIREIVGEAANLDIFKDIDTLSLQSIIDNKGFLVIPPFEND